MQLWQCPHPEIIQLFLLLSQPWGGQHPHLQGIALVPFLLKGASQPSIQPLKHHQEPVDLPFASIYSLPQKLPMELLFLVSVLINGYVCYCC